MCVCVCERGEGGFGDKERDQRCLHKSDGGGLDGRERQTGREQVFNLIDKVSPTQDGLLKVDGHAH